MLPSTAGLQIIPFISDTSHVARHFVITTAKSRYFCLNPFGPNSGKKYRQKVPTVGFLQSTCVPHKIDVSRASST